jgi:hypothetical protein
MKPTKIIHESALERDLRHQRNREQDELAKEIDRVQRREARFKDTKELLGWYFSTYRSMETAPAINPAKEVIQGASVDRDERIHWHAWIYKALKDLAKRQGNDRGVHLLWLHHRQASETGHTREKDGRKRVVFGKRSVAIRDLHEHDDDPAGRDTTIRDYWRAFRLFEEMAVSKGWVQWRVQRRGEGRTEQVYRRRRNDE